MSKLKTLPTREALVYLAEKTGISDRYYIRHLDRWRKHGRIAPCGKVECSNENTYTIKSLDALADTLWHQPMGYQYVEKSRQERFQMLPNTLTGEQWQYALNYFNGCCAACGRQLNDLFGQLRAAKDHWIPLNYEGDDNPGTVATNIVPLCHGIGGCNNHKYNMMPDVWLHSQFGRRKAKEIAARIQTYFDTIGAVTMDNTNSIPPNTIGYGLMCNIQCYVRDQSNNIDMPLVRTKIEECLVSHATPNDVTNSKAWLMEVAPSNISQWPSKVKSLCQFIELQTTLRGEAT